MFERFSESAIKVIMLAQEEARRLGHNFVGSEQILLGLIGEGQGVAAKSLRACGVTLPDARVEVERIIGRGDGFVSVEIPFTPRSKKILELSWREARLLEHNYISTQHLLLAILREGGGVACSVLDVLKVDRERLRIHVLKSVGKVEANLPDSPIVPRNTENMSNSYEYSWYEQNAIAVIQRAWGIAETFGAETIRAEHICIALLRENDLLQVIQKHNRVDLSALRQSLLVDLQAGSIVPASSMVFSSEAVDILTNAWNVALSEKSVWVTKEALMLGALREEAGVFCRALRAVNANPDAIAKDLADLMKTSRSSESLDKVAADSPLPASPSGKAGWSAGGWLIVLVVSALIICAIYLTDHEKFVLIAPALLLICFLVIAVLLFRKAALR